VAPVPHAETTSPATMTAAALSPNFIARAYTSPSACGGTCASDFLEPVVEPTGRVHPLATIRQPVNTPRPVDHRTAPTAPTLEMWMIEAQAID
jgi:hypothetical protein